MKSKKASYTVYFASEFRGLAPLIGNAYLAEAIYEKSHGKYLCVLPQNIEQRHSAAHNVRDADLQALLDCDLGLFSYDGTELDPETVSKFMFAKFGDIPSVILRSDLRKNAGGKTASKTRMTDFFPRTTHVVLDSIGLYKASNQTRLRASAHRNKLDEIVRLAGQHSSADAQTMCEQIAAACVGALDRVVAMEPVIPKHLREEVYQWLALMPDFKGKPKTLRRTFEDILERKVEHGLL